MADLEKILRLVAEGVLSAEEAERIIAALTDDPTVERGPSPHASPGPQPITATPSRHLRIEVSEGGRNVVNLRVPLNIAGLAATFVPGLSEQDSERIRNAVASGLSGPILDIGTDDGDRVLIVTE